MPTDFDVVIVGARVAGAATALLLARAGHRVLLVDRARFPSDIPHGHFIHRHGPARLARWGLLDRLVAAGCPPATTVTSDFGDFPLAARNLVTDGVAYGYGPRRAVLDQLLIDAALEAGAELQEDFPVSDLLVDDGRVTGVIGPRGTRVRARLTIGADGRHSRVARAVHATMYEAVPTLTCWYFSYWSGVSGDGLEVALRGRRATFAHPTTDNLFATFVAWPIAELPNVRTSIEEHFFAVLDSEAPQLAERLRDGHRAERFYGATDVPNFLRQPVGPGWALVGDAGCHKDPLLAMGVCDALRDAELLANAAHRALAEQCPEIEALAEYHQQRDAATLPDFRENIQAARLGPHPSEVLHIRQLVRSSPADAAHLLLASRDMVPRESFFNPRNLARLSAQAEAARGVEQVDPLRVDLHAHPLADANATVARG